MGMAIIVAISLTGCVAGDTLGTAWERQIEEPLLNYVVLTQEIVWPLTGDSISRMLELWFVPPNRFKACYGEPDSQIIVADGTRLWTYAPENRQVLVQEQGSELTWRDSPLGHLLKVEPATVRTDTTLEGRLGQLLTWLDESGECQFTRVEAFVPFGEQWPWRARLVDVGGNSTTYSLLRWHREPASADIDGIFVLDIPRGVEIVPLD
ncbi:outer membrane lipoprotein carrier protein LolA [Candidatus Fermentibacteria bacterium]|nr:outer membrane lipoprotein carrier protein LolA [Candidatus Fermentibacteria bacterium]